jgi:hypothetical protein
MTEIDQMRQDLSFVRQALGRRSRQNYGRGQIYLVWAVYSLVGFALMDVNPNYSSYFFLPGFVVAALLSRMVGKRAARATGEFDRDLVRRTMLHFWGGIWLAMLACVGMQILVPALRGVHGGQLCVVLLGLVYFLAGVHFDGYFLILGPIVMAGGLAVGFIPHRPWTCLGVVIALGLSAPYFIWRRGNGQTR